MDAFWKARGANIIKIIFMKLLKNFFSFTKKNQIVLRKALNVRCVSKYCSWHYLAAVQYGKYQIRKGQNSISTISTLHLANDMNSI